ncbi:MAG: hypothetical protein MUC63_05665, partial [Planctomycetes bacterium]|nr:hypothetical protein [Planctomycetota bacterium]
EFEGAEAAEAELWYVAAGEDRRSRRIPWKGAFGMGRREFFDALLDLPEGPGIVAARGAFLPPDPSATRWKADDTREGRPVTSRIWAQPGADRLLLETAYADAEGGWLSFADARFDPKTGRLRSCRVWGESGRGIVPILSMREKERGRDREPESEKAGK